ncbi:hypothetical protein L0990_02160 [Vibrio kanaloae]|uniref:hypothetical protein n=1 Tax=Vibrio kanaloae TaxID=170673 RepID=UPI0035A5FAA5
MMLKRSFMLVGMFSVSLFSYASEGSISAGESTFRTVGGYGCIACHGLYGQGGGNVGGNIRGKSLNDLKYSLEHEQTMKLLGDALSEQDKINLAEYMEYLGTFQLVDWMYEGTKGALLSVSIDSGKKSQLVVLNKMFESMSIDLSPLAGKHLTLRVEPYETQYFEWLPEKGVYELSYGDEAVSINVK